MQNIENADVNYQYLIVIVRNNNMSVISIIMAAYNVEKTILESINSVRAQTYSNWELIIIDDCSTDSTSDIVKIVASSNGLNNNEYVPQINLLKNVCNLGVSEARNVGINAAKGEWVAILDSDDIWREDKLEKQMQFIKETNADISYTSTSYIDVEGVASRYILHAERELSYKDLLKKNIMSCSSVIVRKEIIKQYPFMDTTGQGITLHEDYASWLKILQENKNAYGLDEPLLTYRLSKSSKSGGRIRSGLMTFNTYRHVGFGQAASILLTLRYAIHSISKRFFIKMRMWI